MRLENKKSSEAEDGFLLNQESLRWY